jgi:hypothetical protein
VRRGGAGRCRGNSRFSYTGTTWQAARAYEAAGRQLGLAGSAARRGSPVAAIVKAAGVTRQAVGNWSAGYGPGPRLVSLPVRRPGRSRGAPVLIVGARNTTPGVFGAVGTPRNSRSQG